MPNEKVVHVGFLVNGTVATRERQWYLGNQETVSGGPLEGAREKRASNIRRNRILDLMRTRNERNLGRHTAPASGG